MSKNRQVNMTSIPPFFANSVIGLGTFWSLSELVENVITTV